MSVFALPGIAIALALVFFGANYAPVIYQSIGLLLLGYVALFISPALGAVRTTLLQVNPRVEEAARVLGRSPLGAFTSVTLPAARPGIAAGASLVFLLTMKELPATLILSPTGFTTLATQVWAFASEAFFRPRRDAFTVAYTPVRDSLGPAHPSRPAIAGIRTVLLLQVPSTAAQGNPL